jgi:hypothetical protein
MSKPKVQDAPILEHSGKLSADEVIALAQQKGEILQGVIDAPSYQSKTGDLEHVAI